MTRIVVEPIAARRRQRALLIPPVMIVAVLGALVAGGGREIVQWMVAGALSGLPILIALTALYVLPGLALLRILLPSASHMHPMAYIGMAVGLSAALPPLVILNSSVIGVRWGAIHVWTYLLLCFLVVLWPTQRSEPHLPRISIWKRFLRSQSIRLDSAGIALIIITSAALIARFFIVRDLPTGLLGDSYHHTLITQLIYENGGLFHSWEPYAPLTTFTYHFGFHANVAFFLWLTGVDSAHGVVIVGQTLGGIIVLMVFVICIGVFGIRPWAGVWATLIVSSITTLPSLYVTWGRYTQLTGQIVGIMLLVCWTMLSDRKPGESLWRLVALAGITGAAMMLTHYLVSVIIGAFLASSILVKTLAQRDLHALMSTVILYTIASCVAIALTAPWLVNLANGYLLRNAAGFVSGSVGERHIVSLSTLPRDIVPLYAKGYVLAAAGIGLCIAAWRRSWKISLAGVWSVLAVIIVAPYIVGLPGAGVIDHITALSSWFLTLPPLAGYALDAVQRRTTTALRRAGTPSNLIRAVMALVIGAVLAWGVTWQTRMIDGTTQLVTHADMAAMRWIRTHIPRDARFLVNSFPAYSGYLLAGSDAGWWIPLLAERQSTLPPITYGSERGPTDDYARRVNAISTALRQRPLTDARPVLIDLTAQHALAVLRDNGVTHIYSGAHAFPSNVDRIDTARLRESPHFRLVYDRDGVEIFELVTQ